MGSIRLWIPTVSMLLVSLISYIDRNTLALLAPAIMKEAKLTGEQYGYVISAFSVAYMLGNPIWGRLLDRFGVRYGMLAAVSFWTLASVSHAWAGGFRSFAVARALLGFGEGATFPGGLRTVVQTLPAVNRSRGIAVAYSGGSLGAIVTPLLITPIAAAWGWRGAFLFTGVIGAARVLLWSIVSRRPEVRDAPRSVKNNTRGPRFNDPTVWAFVCAYAFGGLPLAFVIYGAAIYLSQVMGKSQIEIGSVLWIPPLGWEAGYFFWGWLSDRSLKANANRIRSFQVLLGAATLFSLPLMATPWITSFWVVMLALFLAMFVAAGFIILSIAYATEVYSGEHSAFIAGLGAGSWSAAVALTMPLFGRLFDVQRWDAAFALAAVSPVAGYLGWSVLMCIARPQPAAKITAHY